MSAARSPASSFLRLLNAALEARGRSGERVSATLTICAMPALTFFCAVSLASCASPRVGGAASHGARSLRGKGPL